MTDETPETADNAVEIYTTPSCQYCKKTKAFLAEHDIGYTEYNVSDNQNKRQEMVEKSGQMSVPVTVIGDEIITGFNEDKLREVLEI